MTKERLSGTFDRNTVARSTPDHPKDPVNMASLTKTGLHPRLRDVSMVTRISTWQVSDPGSLRAQLEQKRAEIATLPGVLACHIAWAPNGNGITFAVFSSQSAATAFDALSVFAETTELVSPVTTAAYPDVVILK